MIYFIIQNEYIFTSNIKTLKKLQMAIDMYGIENIIITPKSISGQEFTFYIKINK